MGGNTAVRVGLGSALATILLAAGLPLPQAPAAGAGPVRVNNVKAISRDLLPGPGSSQNDTEAEPSTAVDPRHPHHLVAVFQEGRFPSGGAAAIGFATSRDEGKTWIDGELPGLSAIAGGHFRRASDPVVAFGPHDTVYVVSLLANVSAKFCRPGIGKNAVAVSRSDDGGTTFDAPVLVKKDPGSCRAAVNDKPWIAVDTYPSSPHFGRIYVVWTRTLEHTTHRDHLKISHSDDRGNDWSRPHIVPTRDAVGNVALVQPNGKLTIVWDVVSFSGIHIRSIRSSNGGRTFGRVATVARVVAGEVPYLRTGPPGGFPAATVDPITDKLYVVWQDARLRGQTRSHVPRGSDIMMSRSSDGGRSWASPRRVNRDDPKDSLNHFLPAVGAYGGMVSVSYLTRYRFSHFVRERVRVSQNAGRSFGREHKLANRGDLRHAASVCFGCGTHYGSKARFLGDYMALASARGLAYAVWVRPGLLPLRSKAMHQRVWSATLSVHGV